MQSLFLEGLKTARQMMSCGCKIEDLDALIAEHEADTIETAMVNPNLEVR